jgi:hypothetical protein
MEMMNIETFPITILEAQNIWGKSKRQILWAAWKDHIKARQCSYSRSWLLDYNSCAAFFGKPLDEKLVDDIREDWHGRA